MNLEEAIVAHSAWKSRLRAFITGTSAEKLDERQVARDDACPLGKWLHGGGHGLSGTEFQQLVAEHARFHKAAASVVRAVTVGDTPEAEKHMDVGSEFSLATVQVVTLLRALQRKSA